LRDEVEAPRASHYATVEAHPGRRQVDDLFVRLLEAERPMVILGGTRCNWPINRIIGIESCLAICRQAEALVAPGPR
ncbi:hypothetical protein ACC718_39580, partial [Rhizobium ruizarguesonis]